MNGLQSLRPYGWIIELVLSQSKNGLFSLRGSQIVSVPPIYKTPLIYPIRNGEQLKYAIEETFRDDLFSDKEINWDLILISLNNYFPELQNELLEAIKNNKNKEEGVLKLEEALEIKNKPLNEWLNRSRWPQNPQGRPYGMSAEHLHENSRRREAVFQYANRCLDVNKCLPIGEHLINESLPEIASDRFIKTPTEFIFLVTFPLRSAYKDHDTQNTDEHREVGDALAQVRAGSDNGGKTGSGEGLSRGNGALDESGKPREKPND